MSSQPPLTPAEAAAVAVLKGESDCSWHIGCDEECHADRARAVVAVVRQPIADEVALQLGRDCLRDGLEPFLKRLVGPEHTMRLLSAVRGEILRAAADSWLQTDQAVSMKAGAYVEEWLLKYAKAFESLSLPASKETP